MPVLDVIATKSGVSGIQLQNMAPFADRPGVTNFATTLDYIDQELARQQTLRLALACQIRFRQTGAFPVWLEDLAPDVLTELPIDPFSQSGGLISYRRDGDEAVVYSLGSNESDDLGSEEALKNWHDIGYRIEPPGARRQASEQKPGDGP